MADRWHVWHNLVEAVERCVTRHAAHLREPEPPPSPKASAAALAELEKIATTGHPASSAHRYADRTRERHWAVHALLDQGRTQRAIARELGLSRTSARRFARATTWQELVTGRWQGLPSILDDFKPYLHQRWNGGCTTAATFFEEITAAGYRGGLTVLRDYLRPLRSGAPPRENTRPPSVREVTSWLTRHPDSLTPEETLKLKAILARCPDLEATAGHVHAFAEMMNTRTGHQLPDWIEEVKAAGLPELLSFVNGVVGDQRAVAAGLTLPFSSGAVEGQVNRIKMLKRQMFGRANLDLLRKRVLLAAWRRDPRHARCPSASPAPKVIRNQNSAAADRQLLLSQPEEIRAEVKRHFDVLTKEFLGEDGRLVLPHAALLASACR